MGGGKVLPMTSEERRRGPRYPADSSARYRLDPGADWRRCRIVGVSSEGAAIELYDLAPGESITEWIELELSSPSGDDTPVELRALIRNHHRMPSGQVVVGVEFVLATRRQRQLLELLVRLRSTE
jgi:PilZ domain